LAPRNKGIRINHKTVQKLMNAEKLKCMVRLKKYKSYEGSCGKIVENILKRDFKAQKPNEKWVTDVTEFFHYLEKNYIYRRY